MALRPVLRLGDPRLRQRSQEVPQADLGGPAMTALLRDLRDTMAARSGAGLAAPQIGVPLRVVLFGFEHNPRYPEAPPIPETVLINPVITPLGGDSATGREGCLSVPGLRAPVRRPLRVHYRGIDACGALIERMVEGFHARVVQHECDHLDGILFPDRAGLATDLPLPLPLGLDHPAWPALLPPAPGEGQIRLLLPANWQPLGPAAGSPALQRFAAALASRLAVAGLQPEPATQAAALLQEEGWQIMDSLSLSPRGRADGPLGSWYGALLENVGQRLVQEGWWLEAELGAAREVLAAAQLAPDPTVRGPELLLIDARPGPTSGELPASLHPYTLP